MRTLLSQCIYGGKVDNEFDQRLLESFLEKIFSEKCFEPDHPLVDSGRVVMPEGVRRDQFLGWIEQLADRQVISRNYPGENNVVVQGILTEGRGSVQLTSWY